MARLCIVDLDGVVCDSTARFVKADEAKAAFLDAQAVTRDLPHVERQATDIYWQTALDPSLVPLDTLIPGADEAIEVLERRYQVLYLTSRPEPMRAATLEWLFNHQLSGPKLVMKSPAFQFVKTTVWKTGIIHTLTALYVASEVLVVDDDEANRDELYKYGFEDSVQLRYYVSLHEAVEALQA